MVFIFIEIDLDQIFSLPRPLVLGGHISASLGELVAPLSDALLLGGLLGVVLEGAQPDVDLITQPDPARIPFRFGCVEIAKWLFVERRNEHLTGKMKQKT